MIPHWPHFNRWDWSAKRYNTVTGPGLERGTMCLLQINSVRRGKSRGTRTQNLGPSQLCSCQDAHRPRSSCLRLWACCPHSRSSDPQHRRGKQELQRTELSPEASVESWALETGQVCAQWAGTSEGSSTEQEKVGVLMPGYGASCCRLPFPCRGNSACRSGMLKSPGRWRRAVHPGPGALVEDAWPGPTGLQDLCWGGV